MATKNIVPRSDSEGQLGTSSKFWLSAFLDGLNLGNAAASNLVFTPSTGDTVTFAAGTNGTLTITTVDTAAAAANVGFVVDGTFDINAAGAVAIDGVGVAVGSSGAASLITSGAASDIVVTTVHTAGMAFQLNANTNAASEVEINAGILDINAAGVLTIDSGTSISIGATADKPVIIDSTTFALDAASTIIVDGTGVSIDGTLDSNLTVTGSDKDLTLSVVGGGTQKLILSSAGTGADAISITSSAGGIDILASGAAAGEDIDILATGSSVNITSTENHAGALVLNASEGAASTVTLNSSGNSGSFIINNTSDYPYIRLQKDGTSGWGLGAVHNANTTNFEFFALTANNLAASLSTAGLLTIDDDLVIKAGGTIGGASDTNLLTLADQVLTVAGNVVSSGRLLVTAADGVSNADYVASIRNQEATDGSSFGLAINAGSNAADIALNITDHDAANVLLRVFGNGSAVLTGSLNIGNGTVSTPGLNFAGNGDAGFYNVGGDNIGFAANGAAVYSMNPTGIHFESGKGIDFSNETPSGSGTENALLDDYEEGTWTPSLVDNENQGAANASDTAGFYTKIGRMVHCSGQLIITSLQNVDTVVSVAGFPFTNKNTQGSQSGGVVSAASNLNITAGHSVTLQMILNSTAAGLRVSDSAGGTTDMTHTEFSANGNIAFSITYMTAT